MLASEVRYDHHGRAAPALPARHAPAGQAGRDQRRRPPRSASCSTTSIRVTTTATATTTTTPTTTRRAAEAPQLPAPAPTRHRRPKPRDTRGLLIRHACSSCPSFVLGCRVLFSPGPRHAAARRFFEMRLGGMPAELAQDFNIMYTVSQEGTVNIPLIGKIQGRRSDAAARSSHDPEPADRRQALHRSVGEHQCRARHAVRLDRRRRARAAAPPVVGRSHARLRDSGSAGGQRFRFAERRSGSIRDGRVSSLRPAGHREGSRAGSEAPARRSGHGARSKPRALVRASTRRDQRAVFPEVADAGVKRQHQGEGDQARRRSARRASTRRGR